MLKWLVEISKDEDFTLKLNNIYLYSKYHPKKDVNTFIDNIINKKNEHQQFILFGLGLGYHAEALLKIRPEATVHVILADIEELELCKEYGIPCILEDKRIHIISNELSLINNILTETQFIIPLQWLKAIGEKHPLFASLENIKIRQMSFHNVKEIMHENFLSNTLDNPISLLVFNSFAKSEYAVLVSAGPSLNQTVETLKEISKFCFVLAVGSALKSLLKEGIVPDAVIITDPTHLVQEQIEHTVYNGMLFYMATANHKMVKSHKGEKVILFQNGYHLSEEFATTMKIPLLETGGSVSTTSISLLEFMGFQTVYLFGQDLGFQNNKTHANLSTSSKTYETDMKFQTVLSNNGEYINTYNNFNVFRRWFEQKAANTSMQIYNTALDGAKIEGIPYLSASELDKQLVDALIIDYKKVLDEIDSTK